MKTLVGIVMGSLLSGMAVGAWQAVEPGGKTLCAHGAPYRFFVRSGDPAKVLLFFQGGGACWSSQNCDLENRPTFDPFVGPDDDPGAAPGGIFDLEDARNPLRSYAMVFVSYCSGDVHLGDAARDYPVRGPEGYDRTLHVEHRGYANATAAMDWLNTHTAPRTLMVAGASAGSIAAPFYAELMARRYPEADIAVVSDASGAYSGIDLDPLFETWGAKHVARGLGYEAEVLDDLSAERLITNAAARQERLRFLRYDAAFDESQQFFMTLLGSTADTADAIRRGNAALAEAVPRFSAFLDAGEHHMILEFDRFYEPRTRGRRFHELLADFAGGAVPESVTCAPCGDETGRDE